MARRLLVACLSLVLAAGSGPWLSLGGDESGPTDGLGFQTADACESLEHLQNFWMADGEMLISPDFIAASIDLVELVAPKATLEESELIYRVAVKLISAIVREPGNIAVWLEDWLSAVESMPAYDAGEEHVVLAAHLCDSQFDHVRKLVPFLDIVSHLYLRFSFAQNKEFIRSLTTNSKYLQHLALYCQFLSDDVRLDLLKYFAELIASNRMSLFPNSARTCMRLQWMDHSNQLNLIDILYQMSAEMDLLVDILHHVLDTAASNLDQSREHHYIALRMISLNPSVAGRDPSLLFKLFSLPKRHFRWERRFTKAIFSKLPEASCRYLESDRSLLSVFVELEEVDIASFQKILQFTPSIEVDNVRRNALKSKDPQFWNSLFSSSIAKSIHTLGYQNFFDANFKDLDNRARFEAAVLLDLLSKDGYWDVLASYGPKKLTITCRNAIGASSHNVNLSVLRLIDYCGRNGRLEEDIELVPAMFATPDASAAFIAYLADEIVLQSNVVHMVNDLDDRTLKIGEGLLNVCKASPWLCKAFVTLFLMHFDHDESLLLRASMGLNANIASLYLLISSFFDFQFRPLDTLTKLLRKGLNRSLELYQDSIYLFSQAIAAIQVKVLIEPQCSQISLQFIVANRKNFRSDLFTKPFRVAWKAEQFEDFIGIATIAGLSNEFLPPPRRPTPIENHPDPRIGAQRLRARKISSITDYYVLESQLGQGSFGVVYQAKLLQGGHSVAIKKMGLRDACVAYETDFMTTYCHSDQIPGVVQLLDAMYTASDIYLVMELIEGQMLHDWSVPTKAEESADALLRIIYQITLILHRLHEQNRMHGDLQHLGNFLIEKSTNNVVLIDFGFTRRVDNPCGDSAQLYNRFEDLMLKVKSKFHLTWYDGAPDPFRALEKRLRKMRDQEFRCLEFLSDSIFDKYHRDSFVRKSPQTKDFPIHPRFEPVNSNDPRSQRVLSTSYKHLDDSTCSLKWERKDKTIQRQSIDLKLAESLSFAATEALKFLDGHVEVLDTKLSRFGTLFESSKTDHSEFPEQHLESSTLKSTTPSSRQVLVTNPHDLPSSSDMITLDFDIKALEAVVDSSPNASVLSCDNDNLSQRNEYEAASANKSTGIESGIQQAPEEIPESSVATKTALSDLKDADLFKADHASTEPPDATSDAVASTLSLRAQPDTNVDPDEPTGYPKHVVLIVLSSAFGAALLLAILSIYCRSGYSFKREYVWRNRCDWRSLFASRRAIFDHISPISA